jgi:release factor glutamine methyltransferase
VTDSWTIKRLLDWSTGFLGRSGSDSPRLDTQLFLSHVCGLDKVQLYVQFERPLVAEELATLKELIRRRSDGEPVAYILGERDFYGRTFEVSPDVLIPRPETEHLVDLALTWLRTHAIEAPKLVDVGTGSGAIAVSLAAELPTAIVVATDISPGALEVAARNAEKHGVREQVKFTRGDLLEPLKTAGAVDAVISNPPYLDDELMASAARDVVEFEPRLALHGGPDGLDILRRLTPQAARVLKPGGLFAVELAGRDQATALAAFWRATGEFENIEAVTDYSGRDRILRATRCTT